jgi:hypothetical protein
MHKRSGEKDGKGSVEPKKVMGCGSVPKKAKTASRTTPDSNPELEDVTIKEEEIDYDEEEEIEEEEEEDMCNVFTHEMDNLECDICFQPFESRVYSVSTQTFPTFRHEILLIAALMIGNLLS